MQVHVQVRAGHSVILSWWNSVILFEHVSRQKSVLERRLWWAVMASEVALARLEDHVEHSFLRFLKRLEASWR